MSKCYEKYLEIYRRENHETLPGLPVVDCVSHVDVWQNHLELLCKKKKSEESFALAYHRLRLRHDLKAFYESDRYKEYKQFLFVCAGYETTPVAVTKKIEINAYPVYMTLKRGDKGRLLDPTCFDLAPQFLRCKFSMKPAIINGDVFFLSEDEFRVIKNKK